MPAQHCLWLHDQQGGLSGTNQRGQQDQEDAISSGESWPFHLSLQNDELLSEEGIFRQKLLFTSRKISEGGQRQRGPQRFGPTSKMSGEYMQATNLQPLESGEHTTHTKSFSII